MLLQLDESLFPLHNTPEKKLWAAVLVQAFSDLEGLAFGNQGSIDNNRNQAKGWIKSNDDSYIGSFLYVCEVLDLNPEFVKAKFRNTEQRINQKEKMPKGIKARIKAFDPAKLEGMTCLQIASYFNTSKSLVYNIVSDLGIKYKQVRKGAGYYRKKIIIDK